MEAKDYIPIYAALIGLGGTFLTCVTALAVAFWINRNLQRHETVFGYLHKRRAEVVEELHKKLEALGTRLDICMNIHRVGDVSKQREALTEAQNIGNAFLDYFRNHHLFLTRHFIDRVEKQLLFELRDYVIRIGNYISNPNLSTNQELEDLRAISRQFRKVIVPILQDLETQNRQVIGSDEVTFQSKMKDFVDHACGRITKLADYIGDKCTKVNESRRKPKSK